MTSTTTNRTNATTGSGGADQHWLYRNVSSFKCVARIERDKLYASETNCTELSNYRTIASYNWLWPLMIVPGRPHRLASDVQLVKLHAQQLTKQPYECQSNVCISNDSGSGDDDDYPIESLFRAVQVCQPRHSLADVELAITRHDFKLLLRFVEGRERMDHFRVDFQLVGRLLVLVCSNEKHYIPDYGKDFETKATDVKATTTTATATTTTATNTALDSAIAYYRVVSYTFGDFKVLTQFQVDCCAPKTTPPSTRNDIANLDAQHNDKSVMRLISKYTAEYMETSSASASNKQQQTATKQRTRAKQFSPASKLAYITCGVFDENEELVELTTRSANCGRYVFPDFKWDQMFFSRTERLVLAWHDNGKLQKIEKLSFSQVTQRCRRRFAPQEPLGKLNTLLLWMRAIAYASATTTSVHSAIYEPQDDDLAIYACANHRGCLPRDIHDTIVRQYRRECAPPPQPRFAPQEESIVLTNKWVHLGLSED